MPFLPNHQFFGYVMTAREILEQVDGLTHDKLTYFVRAGYLNPKKIERGSMRYSDFSEKDLALVKIAWDYIQTYGTKTSIAFKKAQDDLNDSQMDLF